MGEKSGEFVGQPPFSGIPPPGRPNALRQLLRDSLHQGGREFATLSRLE
jgi:hypothetical protein